MEKKDKMKIKGRFDIEKITKNNIVSKYYADNTIVSDGKSSIASMIISDGTPATTFDFLAIGSGVSAASITQTALDNEVYGRINASGTATGSVSS